MENEGEMHDQERRKGRVGRASFSLQMGYVLGRERQRAGDFFSSRKHGVMKVENVSLTFLVREVDFASS